MIIVQFDAGPGMVERADLPHRMTTSTLGGETFEVAALFVATLARQPWMESAEIEPRSAQMIEPRRGLFPMTRAAVVINRVTCRATIVTTFQVFDRRRGSSPWLMALGATLVHMAR